MKYSEIDEEVKKSLKRDWIITNGIGGFCSQSALGCNTRKYHGLLIAPLTPPARRFLILSKLDESIETNGTKYNLFTEGKIKGGFVDYYTTTLILLSLSIFWQLWMTCPCAQLVTVPCT